MPLAAATPPSGQRILELPAGNEKKRRHTRVYDAVHPNLSIHKSIHVTSKFSIVIFAGRIKGHWTMYKGHAQCGGETSLCANRLLVLGHDQIDYHAIALGRDLSKLF